MNVLTRIKKCLAPPVFEDEDKTRAARILNTTLLAILVIVVMAGIASPLVFTGAWQGWVSMSIAALLVLGGLLLMRRGHVKLAARLFSFGVWALHTLLALVSGGMSSLIPASGYMFVIVMAALLLGGRAAFAFVGLTTVAGLGMLYVESIDLLPPPFVPLNSVSGWASLTANLIMVPLLLYFAVQSINEALERARRNERALAESNRELQAEIAERVRAEQALRESEERFRSIVEQSSDGIILTDEQGAIIEWNQGQEQITGVEQADVLGRPLWDVQLWDGRNIPAMYEQVKTSMLEFLETGQAPWLNQLQEIIILRPDKARRVVQAMIFPIKTTRGFMAGIITRDITKEVQTEEKLQESAEKVRAMFESVTDGITFTDLQGNIVETNEAVVRLHGYESQDEIIGQSSLEFIAERDRARAVENVQKTLADGHSGILEYKFVTKDGKEFDAELSAVLLKDEEGNPSGFVALTRDITERKRAEDALRQREELLNSTQRLTKVGGWEWDMQNQTIFWTEETYRIHGFDPNEMEPGSTEYIGRSLECYDPDDRSVLSEAFERCIQQGKAYDLEFPFTTVQGQRKWIRTTTQAERDKGKVVKVIGYIADITERKRAEEALQEYSERLEEMVAERTRELEQAQAELLRQERLSALGQLTATVAHEIRNPLGTVRTAVFAISDAIERDEMGRVERALKLGERNIVRCDNIITELLDYTRERTLNLEPIYVDVWLGEVLDEMQSSSVGQNIPESVVYVRELSANVQIPLDREHLRRAVINVIENAVDAMQDDAASLTVTGNKLTVSTRVAGEWLEIHISDTGCGIPVDEMDKIFEPLFSTKTYGVGLGLPIVKNIIEQHGGAVEIESKVGKGTTVGLWLPTAKEGGD